MKLFKISGYWKDNHETFENYAVRDTEDDGDDDEIFYYGLSEDDILKAIALEENSKHEFVITSYEKV